MPDDYPSILPPLNWLTEQISTPPPEILDWLQETGSMTSRLENHCQRVQVKPQREGFIQRNALRDEALHLPESERYWLREVILFGDSIPWLLARTVIPQETLSGPEGELQQLGTQPLGRYLFNKAKLTRDYIHIGQGNQLWARRSRLRLTGKPLLLTELFLATSPVYNKI